MIEEFAEGEHGPQTRGTGPTKGTERRAH
jgi:hypothetical protein